MTRMANDALSSCLVYFYLFFRDRNALYIFIRSRHANSDFHSHSAHSPADEACRHRYALLHRRNRGPAQVHVDETRMLDVLACAEVRPGSHVRQVSETAVSHLAEAAPGDQLRRRPRVSHQVIEALCLQPLLVQESFETAKGPS